MKIDFEKEYSSIILKRGFEYYNNGYVKNVKVKNNEINAVVEGTDDYHVSIELDNNKIMVTNCNCPYFYDHDECKHITAVLYYLANENLSNKKETPNITSILSKINEKELKIFLGDLIENDEAIYDLFRRKFVDYFPKISPATYKRKIFDAIREAGGRDGFIDYNEGWEYTRKMHEFTNEASNLVDRNDYETAFAIVKIILDSIPDTAIDGSNGETSIVADSCIEVIVEILNSAPHNNKTIRDVFEYVLLELQTHNLDNYGIELDNLIINFIRKDLFTEECESALLNAIEDCDNSSKWYSYSKKYYLEYLSELYDRTGNIDKKLILIENNLDDIETFKKYVSIIMEKEEINEVISALKKYQQKYPNHQKFITDTLLEIYQNNHMEPDYKEELYNAFFKYDEFNFEKYIKIKKLYNQSDWLNEREQIITKVQKSTTRHFDILTKIYIEEKMIDALYEYVSTNGDVNHFEEYLLPKYRDELIEINIKKSKKNLKFASNRNAYRGIAGELMHINRLDIHKKYISDFLVYIRTEYASKPALMDEISHIK